MAELIYKILESEQELQGSDGVRRRVFSDEQDIDEKLVFKDSGVDSFDMVVKDGDKVIGTARVVLPEGNAAKIERMAVLAPYRRKGIGGDIISFLRQELKSRGITKVILHAQYRVVDFYKSCGFKETGLPFTEAGIKHVKMELDLENNRSEKQVRIHEIEKEISDLKARWPTHSVPPSMWQQLEKLEDELEATLKEKEGNER